MKKDQKFLNNLEKALGKMSKAKKEEIVLKYRKIIDEELNNKTKIVKILKNIGTPEEVAKRELEELKNKSFFKKIFSRSKKEKVEEFSEEQTEEIQDKQ